MASGHRVILCLGSNVSDRCRRVADATRYISTILLDWVYTKPYETPERDGAEILYYNSVGIGVWDGEVTELNRIIKEYEVSNGRDAGARAAGIVPIDVDIVVWDDEVIRPNDFNSDFFKIGLKILQPDNIGKCR